MKEKKILKEIQEIILLLSHDVDPSNNIVLSEMIKQSKDRLINLYKKIEKIKHDQI